MDEIIFLKKIQNYNFGIIKMIYLILSNCNYKDEYKYKKIIIETDEFLIFTPIDETDEIKMEIKKNYKFSKNKCIYFDAYNGQKVFDIKQCVNFMGCVDQYSIGINSFTTSFSILCELNLLGFYISTSLNLENEFSK